MSIKTVYFFLQESPYVMLREPADGVELHGNEQYKGYCIDLLKMIADDVGFKYEIQLVEDGNYGADVDGTWNGMVGELITGVSQSWNIANTYHCCSTPFLQVLTNPMYNIGKYLQNCFCEYANFLLNKDINLSANLFKLQLSVEKQSQWEPKAWKHLENVFFLSKFHWKRALQTSFLVRFPST